MTTVHTANSLEEAQDSVEKCFSDHPDFKIISVYKGTPESLSELGLTPEVIAQGMKEETKH